MTTRRRALSLTRGFPGKDLGHAGTAGTDSEYNSAAVELVTCGRGDSKDLGVGCRYIGALRQVVVREIGGLALQNLARFVEAVSSDDGRAVVGEEARRGREIVFAVSLVDLDFAYGSEMGC